MAIRRRAQDARSGEPDQPISPDRDLDSPSERRAANTLIRFAPGCLGNSMPVSTRLLRGAAAEAVLENFRTADPDRAQEIRSTRMEAFLAATPDPVRLKDEASE